MDLKKAKRFYNEKKKHFRELQLKYFFNFNELREDFYCDFSLDKNNQYITFLILFKQNDKFIIKGKRLSISNFKKEIMFNATFKRMVDINGNELQGLRLRVDSIDGW